MCVTDAKDSGSLVSPSHDAFEPNFSGRIIRCMGHRFHGSFPHVIWSYIHLVGVDYVSKWVEAIPCKTSDHRVVLKFLKANIFSRFGVPKAIISDGGITFL